MAKAKAKALVNLSSGVLSLWDGRDIAPGASLDMSDELAGNAGVQSWITDGLLGEASPAMVAQDTSALEAAIADRDAEVAALKAKVESLEADLGKATTPTA